MRVLFAAVLASLCAALLFQNFSKQSAPFAFGIAGHLTQTEYLNNGGINYATQLGLLSGMGATWYRFELGVSQPPTGPVSVVLGNQTYVWTPNPNGAGFTALDSLQSAASSKGIQLLPVIIPIVDRTNDSLTTIYNKSFAAANLIVSRYKNSIHYWELSNEEDNQCIKLNTSGESTSHYDPAKYAVSQAILQGLADGVRAADPSATRIINFAGWLHTAFFDYVMGHVSGSRSVPFEIVGVHWYSGMGEITCPGESLPDKNGKYLACKNPPLHFNVVQRLQSITGSKPMWMTETNYSPQTSDVNTNITAESAYLPSILGIYIGAPAKYPFGAIFLYELLDQPSLVDATKTYNNAAQSQVGLYQVTSSAGADQLGAAKPAVSSITAIIK